MCNNFVKSRKELCLLLVSCGKPDPCKKFNQFDSSAGQKERFLQMQYCLTHEGISLNHTLYPNLVINFSQQENTEYKKKKAKNNTWRLNLMRPCFQKGIPHPLQLGISTACSHTSTASQDSQYWWAREVRNIQRRCLAIKNLKIFRVLATKPLPDTMKLYRKYLKTWIFFSFHKYTLKDRFTPLWSTVTTVSLSSTQSHWSYKLQKFTCHPSLPLDGKDDTINPDTA